MIRMRFRPMPSFSLLCLVAPLLSCGKTRATRPLAPPPAVVASAPESSADTGAATDTVLPDAYVNCDNSAKCNPGVGMLAYSTSNAAGICTAWLVSPDTIATNSHCVSPAMRDSPAFCQQHMKMLFPRVGDLEPVQALCSEVIESSEPSDLEHSEVAQDYALIRLQVAVSRPPIKVDSQGFAQGEKVTMAKVDPYEGVLGGNLTSVECEVVKDSLLLLTPGQKAPFVLLAGCDTSAGNSGAPLLGRDGQARGFFHTPLAPETITSKFANFSPFTPDSIAVGTNLGCVRSDRWPGLSINNVCNSRAKLFDDIAQNQARYFQRAMSLLGPSQGVAEASERLGLGAWLAANPAAQRLEWDVETIPDDAGARVIPAPRCLKTSLAWLKPYRLDRRGRGYQEFVTVSVDARTIILKVGLNNRFEMGVTKLEYFMRPYSLTFSPREINSASSLDPRPAVSVAWAGKVRDVPFCSP